MLYVVIVANVAAAAAKISIVWEGFETRLMAESFSMRATASL
jgi:hypothetical protein